MNWKNASLVLLAGAVGGLTSWFLQVLIGVKPFDQPASLAIPGLIVVGGVAGWIGVYLVGNSDTSTSNELTHTLAFALACGISWQAVIQSGTSFVSHALVDRQTSSLETSGQVLSDAVQSKSTPVPPKILETAKLTTDLIQKLPAVGDSTLKAKAVAQTVAAVDQIGSAAPQAPAASISALEDVGLAAIQGGQTEVAKRVIHNLGTISAQNPDLAGSANTASSHIMDAAQLLTNQFKMEVPADVKH